MHPKISNVAISCKDDKYLGAAVSAGILSGLKTTEQEIVNFCSRRLSDYKIPDIKIIPKILIVDDDESCVKLMEEILKMEGYFVNSVGNGKDAISWLTMNRFDIVLMDLNLPDISGIELTKKVNELYPDTVIIIITGFPSLDSSITGLELNVFDYLVKPIDIDKLF